MLCTMWLSGCYHGCPLGPSQLHAARILSSKPLPYHWTAATGSHSHRALPSAGGSHPVPGALHAALPAREHTTQPTRQYSRQGLGTSRQTTSSPATWVAGRGPAERGGCRRCGWVSALYRAPHAVTDGSGWGGGGRDHGKPPRAVSLAIVTLTMVEITEEGLHMSDFVKGDKGQQLYHRMVSNNY